MFPYIKLLGVKKNMAKWIAITLGVLLLVTNGAWLFGAIDLAVTEKYRQLEEHNNQKKIIALTKLGNHFVAGQPKEEIQELIVRLYPDTESFEKEGHLYIHHGCPSRLTAKKK